MKDEKAVIFTCAGDRLIGILHPGKPEAETGVVIVVGGPQYRAGSHRQFVLMARGLAGAGIPVLRFDCRGMGDAEGEPRSFEAFDEDIRAAINCLLEHLSGVNKVVLLGLCDAASANLMYATGDSRVAGLVLLNPWVRTTHGEAKSYLRHYYLQRVTNKSFWQKVLGSKFAFSRSIREFLQFARAARSPKHGNGEADVSAASFLPRMRSGLEQFHGPILLLISGRDLTAREFDDLCRDDDRWKKAAGRRGLTRQDIPGATHTLSEFQHLELAGKVTLDWLSRNLSL